MYEYYQETATMNKGRTYVYIYINLLAHYNIRSKINIEVCKKLNKLQVINPRAGIAQLV
jgi:hypothetical protein